MKRWARKLLEKHIRGVIAPHHTWLTVLAFLLTGVAIWMIATTWNINSSFRTLLAEDSEANRAYRAVAERLGSGSALFTVIDSPDLDANIEFAKKYAEKLRSLDSVALAHYHNDKTFYENHLLLYLPVERLEQLRRRVKKKLKQKKREANPLFVSLDDEKSESSDGDWFEGHKMARAKRKLKHTDYKEYLVSDDQYSVTIVVRFVETSTNLMATNRLLDKVKKVGQKLDPASYHPEMKLQYGGGLINRQQEYESIVSDIKYSALFTLLGILFVIALYFRRIRAVTFVLAPLIMGVLWTLALGFWLFGELTIISVFIFAIILGLGIDFGIHLLSSYDTYRYEGNSPVDALVDCYADTGRATVIGALTTFATFVVISFADFKGLAQFGQISSIGVICTLVAMLFVLPALVLTWHDLHPYRPSNHPPLLIRGYQYAKRVLQGLAPTSRSGQTDGTTEPNGEVGRVGKGFESAGSSEAPRPTMFDIPVNSTTVTAAVVLSGLLTAGTAMALPYLEFEENFHSIGNLKPVWQQNDSGKQNVKQLYLKNIGRFGKKAAKYVDERAVQIRKKLSPETFKRQRTEHSVGDKYTSAVNKQTSSTPTVLLFDSKKEARKLFRRARQLQREGELKTFRAVDSIYAFMPGTKRQQKRRLQEIRKIKRLVQKEDLELLKKKDRKRIDQLRKHLQVEQPVGIYDLPNWTKRLFREAGPNPKQAAEGEDFAFEYIVFINEKVDLRVGKDARQFLREVRSLADQTGVDFKMASQANIYVSMLDHIKISGPKMILIALIIVLGLLALTFGGLLRGLFALLPLLFGAFWMLGLSVLVGLRLDFFNVIIIPVVIGIGIDDGVHFYVKYLKHGVGSIERVLHTVGSAVAMTSVTSGIGFGGLAIAEYSGLQSIGYLAILGIASTFVATILLLPALLWLAERSDTLSLEALLPE